MNITIKTWIEDIYYSYLKLMVDNTVLYDGSWNYSLVSTKDYRNTEGIDLNYGMKGHYCSTVLSKFKGKYFTIPDIEEMYKYDYKYTPAVFSESELLKLISEKNIENIKEISNQDLKTEWIKLSGIRDYFSTLEEYKKVLSREVYYIDKLELNDNLEEMFKILFEVDKQEIVEIEYKNSEIIDVYLNSGIVWKAFLKIGNRIYLNTKFEISIDVTEIIKKFKI